VSADPDVDALLDPESDQHAPRDIAPAALTEAGDAPYTAATAAEEDPAGVHVVASPELAPYDPAQRQESAPETSDSFHSAPWLRPRFVPNLGDSAIFIVLTLVIMIAVGGLTVWGGKRLHLFGNEGRVALENDARLSIPSQAVEYLAVFALSSMLFAALWRQPFLKGVHWNAAAVRGRLRWLIPIGIAVGFLVGLGGDFLPMPKDAPIVQDMMNTSAGAWLMFFFSFTGAPLMEELAFRGFMLPAFVNAFRWMSERSYLPSGAARWVGIPFSVLLTSACFAWMHSPQVSGSWGPVLLIGIVSLVLCIVRLALDSVLAGAVVHAAYNFTLFSGILVSTSAFRHLDKLKG